MDAGEPEPQSWWVWVDAIEQNDYNLGAGHYKPKSPENAPKEDPSDLIHETLAIEREILTGLEKLLNGVEALK